MKCKVLGEVGDSSPLQQEVSVFHYWSKVSLPHVESASANSDPAIFWGGKKSMQDRKDIMLFSCSLIWERQKGNQKLMQTAFVLAE